MVERWGCAFLTKKIILCWLGIIVTFGKTEKTKLKYVESETVGINHELINTRGTKL